MRVFGVKTGFLGALDDAGGRLDDARRRLDDATMTQKDDEVVQNDTRFSHRLTQINTNESLRFAILSTRFETNSNF